MLLASSLAAAGLIRCSCWQDADEDDDEDADKEEEEEAQEPDELDRAIADTEPGAATNGDGGDDDDDSSSGEGSVRCVDNLDSLPGVDPERVVVLFGGHPMS